MPNSGGQSYNLFARIQYIDLIDHHSNSLICSTISKTIPETGILSEIHICVYLLNQPAYLLGIRTGVCNRVAGFVSGEKFSALLLSIRSGVFDQDLCSAIRARSNSLSAWAEDFPIARAKTKTTAWIIKNIPIQMAIIPVSFPNSNRTL
jgi:hypothetical protein